MAMGKNYRSRGKHYEPLHYKEMQGVVYGPPPVDRRVDIYRSEMQPTVYGPPPVPMRKGCMAGLIIAIIAAVVAIIFFFIG